MTTGLADTSVIVDWADPKVRSALPDDTGVSAITMAELAAGPHLARDPGERAERQARLQEAEALFEAIPFDGVVARSYGIVVAAVSASGRTHRSRVADLMIAATAHAHKLTLYTRNRDDFHGLEQLITIVDV